MSARPLSEKKRRRVARAIRKGRLPVYFDLLDWLIRQGYATTKREAREIVRAKRVSANSHPVGDIVKVPTGTQRLGQHSFREVVPAVRVELRNDLIVSAK